MMYNYFEFGRKANFQNPPCGYVFRIDFLKSLNNDNKKVTKILQ